MTAKHGPRDALRRRTILAPRGDPSERWGALADRVAEAFETPFPAAVRASAAAWLERLDEWNERIDLTASRSPEERVDLMLADALFLAPRLPPGALVIDVGSGAGAPGLPLALLRDDLRVTLVEPLGKRASFLRTVAGATGLANVLIERVRGESLAGRRAWDVAISRATLAPAPWLALGATLVKPGGRVAVLLAREPVPGFDRGIVERDESYAWPLTGARRRAVVYRVH